MIGLPNSTAPLRSRRRALRTIGVGLAGLVTLAACSGRDGDNTAATTAASGAGGSAVTTTMATKVEVTDQRGVKTTLDKGVEKIAFAVIPAPAIFAAVDRSWDRIVGINQSTLVANKGGMFATIFPKSASTEVISGSDFVPNVENILKLDPDVVVQWGDRGDDVVAPITKAGFPVVGLKYGTQEYLETWITLFAELAGKPERGKHLVDWQHARIAAITDAVAKAGGTPPKAMMLSRMGDGYGTTTDAGYDGFQFKLVGANQVSTGFSASQSAQVSPEQILAWDPEFIFLSAFDEMKPSDIYNDTRLATVSAVKNKRVYKTPLGAYRWQVPGAESPLMWQWFFDVLHPDKASRTLRKQVADAFDDLYAYKISEDQIDQVLRFDLNAGNASYDQFRR